MYDFFEKINFPNLKYFVPLYLAAKKNLKSRTSAFNAIVNLNHTSVMTSDLIGDSWHGLVDQNLFVLDSFSRLADSISI